MLILNRSGQKASNVEKIKQKSLYSFLRQFLQMGNRRSQGEQSWLSNRLFAESQKKQEAGVGLGTEGWVTFSGISPSWRWELARDNECATSLWLASLNSLVFNFEYVGHKIRISTKFLKQNFFFCYSGLIGERERQSGRYQHTRIGDIYSNTKAIN